MCNVSWKFLIKIENTLRREIKEQASQLILLYRCRAVRRSHWRYCVRNLFLKILQYPQETPVLQPILKKSADLQTSANGCFLIFSIVHSYMDLNVWGLDCMTTSAFRVQVTGLVFVFKSVSLVLKQVPACIPKTKTNTFDKSIKFLHFTSFLHYRLFLNARYLCPPNKIHLEQFRRNV